MESVGPDSTGVLAASVFRGLVADLVVDFAVRVGAAVVVELIVNNVLLCETYSYGRARVHIIFGGGGGLSHRSIRYHILRSYRPMRIRSGRKVYQNLLFLDAPYLVLWH